MARLLLLGVGAALMYLWDPDSGRKRRADLKNRADAAVRDLQRAGDALARDATNRAHGAMKGRWSPTSRATAGALGTGLLTYGYLRGGVRGFVYGLVGSGLLARATTNREISSLVKGETLPVEKTLRIAAPVEEVFAYWRNLENFPQWMSHVREVRYMGGDRYHWSVDGPAGVPVEWESELLNVADNREMTWRSVEGAAVGHTGRVRFERDGDGTRVHVQLRYTPMGGIIGHAVAKAFGVDPMSEMDDDLQRLKSLVETGRPPRDSAVMRGGNGATPPM